MKTRCILFILLLGLNLLIVPAEAATYYWVGGSGSWTNLSHWSLTSGGASSPTVIPSPSDDIIIDQNSFAGNNTININLSLAIVSFKSLTVTEQSKTITFSGGNILKVYGSLIVSPQTGFPGVATIEFEALTTGNIVSLHNKAINEIRFQGIGGEWELGSNLRATNTIHFLHGSLKTAGHSITTANFVSTNTNTRNLVLSNSTINATNWSVNGSGMTLNAGSSLMKVSQFYHSVNATYHNLDVTASVSGDILVFNVVWAEFNDVSLGGNITYDTLHLAGEKFYKFWGTHTFLGTLKAIGTDCSKRLKMEGMTGSVQFIKATDSITVKYVEIKNISAGGGAIFKADYSTDMGGNAGWIFPPQNPRTLFWVGGSGGWTQPAHWSLVSNGPGGECIPTQYDDVFFDGFSFGSNDILVLDSTIQRCHDMTWNISVPVNVSNSPSVGSPVIKVYGSLRWDYDISWNTKADVDFMADTAGKTITSDGNRFPGDIRFKGQGGEWALIDDLIADTISHYEGIVRTFGNKLSLLEFHSIEHSVRRLIFFNSIIELDGEKPIFEAGGSNLILNAGTSLIRFLSAGELNSYHSSPLAFYNVDFLSETGTSKHNNIVNHTYNRIRYRNDCDIKGSFTVNHAELNGGHTYKIQAFTNVQVIDSIVFLSNCQNPTFISSSLDSIACFITKAGGVVQGERLILKDVHGVGGATFNAVQSVDLTNNTGWNFLLHPGYNLYWVNGEGNWDDSYHWSFTSGGTGGACIPTPVDNVFFDQNSFPLTNDTVFIKNANAFCLSKSWTIGNKSPIFKSLRTSKLWIFGSLKLDTGMTFLHDALTIFASTQTGRTIESAGKTFPYYLEFAGHGGEWSLIDSLTVKGKIFHNRGSLKLAKKNLSCGSYYSETNYYRLLDMRNTSVKVNYDPITYSVDWKILNGDYKLLADSSELIFGFGSPQIILGTQDSLKFWHAYINSKGIIARVITTSLNYSYFKKLRTSCGTTFDGKNYFDSLVLVGPKEFLFSSTEPQKIRILATVSDCNKRVGILSNSAPATGLIFNNTGGCTVNDCDINNVIVQGGGIIQVQNATSQGLTTGWQLLPKLPLNLYWVNGTGNWNQPEHWSFTSGGPGGACIPGPDDNVFFDQNSFFKSDDTVNLNVSGACHNMTWGGYSGNPLFLGAGKVAVYGSMYFDQLMMTKNIDIDFVAAVSGKTIATSFKPLRYVIFNGDGGWALTQGLNTLTIAFLKGNLNTNGTMVKATSFSSTSSTARTLSLGNSQCDISNSWTVNGLNLNLNAGTSSIEMNFGQMIFQNSGAPLSYYNVIFKGATNIANLTSIGQTLNFNKVYFHSSAIVLGAHHFDSLYMSPGMSYQLDVSKTQTIKDYWYIRGNNCEPINLRSTVLGTQATVYKATGIVSGDFIHMRDIKATGNASFFAGNNSTNTANNTAWIFNNQPGYNYGLGNDTTVCSFLPFLLKTDNFNGGKWFLWSTGSTASFIQVTQSGQYWVKVYYKADCFVTDTINIKYFTPLMIDFGPDTSICEGDTLTLTVPQPYNSLTWNTGTTGNTYHVTQSGTYHVSVIDTNQCRNADTVKVKVIGLPRPNLGKDTHICLDDSALIDAGIYIDYLWNDSSTSRFLMVYDPGHYWVQVTGQCGTGSDTIRLYTIDCDFFVPNVFTPNNDGVNDYFEVVSKNLSRYNLVIFNRWGDKLFTTNDLSIMWDGRFKGEDCSDGVYFWVAEYEKISNFGVKTSFKSQGSVTLMR